MKRPIEINEGAWKAASDVALGGIAQWRREHPRATFDEIEDAVRQRIRPVLEQVLTDAMQGNEQTSFHGGDRPVCPTCGGRLQAKGRKRRTVLTHQGESIALNRTYGDCPRCQAGFFPPGS